MSGREVFHRASQQGTILSMRIQHCLGMSVVPDDANTITSSRFCTSHSAQLPDFPYDPERLEHAANGLMAGSVNTAQGSWQWEPVAGIWHQAPDTGRLWPKRFFAAIPYREGNPYGDVRALWEPARLQHLVELALIARRGSAGRQRKAVAMITAQLHSWVEDNPPLVGPHYISAMECGLRLIAACHALDLVRGGLLDASPWQDLLAIVYSHAPLIERRISLHSSSGNHTIAEGSALVYAGMLFPELRHACDWRATGLRLLRAEAQRQILPDGGGIEQAIDYHVQNTQLLSLVSTLLTHHGIEVPVELREALERSNRFLASMITSGMRLPRIGDSDDGAALCKSLRLPGEVSADPPQTRTFGNTGYTVARLPSAPPAKLVFDHGPLGMPPAFGHGHADALAIVLTVGDDDVLLDAGTYTYTGDPQWRAYFRGTRAHNTVTVDGIDQAVQQGCFQWSTPFRCRLIASAIDRGEGRLLAVHDGYARLGVLHARGVAWSTDRGITIWDGLFGTDEHLIELHWHLGVPLGEWRDERTLILEPAASGLEVSCTGGSLSVHRGERSPILGWRSPSYGQLEPITTVKVTHRGTLPHELITRIRLTGDDGIDRWTGRAISWFRQQIQQSGESKFSAFPSIPWI
ncbi:heparinase II/III domain-containing protein [Arhodomonas sp. AD133]|uniref:heparinase II/III domain-containing protein n=1 Tax=Arhodomonas sp. AD133 TaxID=3415009 RepID=UPI003EBBBA45